MNKRFKKLIVFVMMLVMVIPQGNVLGSTPGDQNFDSVAVTTNGTSTLTVDSLVFSTDGGGEVEVCDYTAASEGSSSAPGFEGRVITNDYSGANTPTFFRFKSVNLADNFKLDSLYVLATMLSIGASSVISIDGYNNGAPVAQVSIIDLSTTGTYGAGDNTITYSRSINTGTEKGGTLTFGDAWTEIDDVVIRDVDNNQVLEIALDSLEFSNPDITPPTVTITTGTTAGGDAIVTAAEKAAGFNVVAQSNEATGTLYVVPSGTANNLGAITGASIASAASAGANSDTTIAISAGNAGVIEGTTYRVYAVDGAGNISTISEIAFTAEILAPTATITAATTAGGDARINIAEKAAGFNVVARSSEATGTLYVVPSGTANNIGAITGASIASAATAGANTDTTIAISANNAGVTNGTVYKVYAVDGVGNISAISGVAFTADLGAPTATITAAATAGGDALVNVAEKAAGFDVVAQSSEATGTLYVVPSGTVNNLGAITGAAIANAASVGAGSDTTIGISAGNAGVINGTAYKVYAVDAAGNISTISNVAFTAELQAPTVTITAGTTAGGDALVTAAEKAAGFDVVAQSSEGTGTLYVVPSGTASTIGAITGASIASAGSAGAGSDTTIGIAAGNVGVTDGTSYKVYAVDGVGNISVISGIAFTADLGAPAATITAGTTAGGDALVNVAEKAAGFNVVAQSSEATGTLYVVPSGTANNLGAITGSAIASAATAGANTDTTITISAGNAGVTNDTAYKVYAIDGAGNISTISGVAFTADLGVPTATITAGTTAGGDALVNEAEKTAGFNVVASSSEATGTLYVVPVNTANAIGAITGAAIASEASVGAGSDTTIGISAGNAGVIDGTSYKVYAVDASGNISVISSVAFTVDLTTPTLSNAVRTDNTHIMITLDENCANIVKANNGGFTVIETGAPGTTYAVSSIAQGVDASHVVLTFADMGISAKEGVTVTYTLGGNGTIWDNAENLMLMSSIGVAAWDTTSPTITSGTLASSNTYMDIVFSEGIYGASDGTTAMSAVKLALTFTQNAGTATNVVISSIKKNDNTVEGSASVLTGGETTVRVFLTVTGSPSGIETIEIKPSNGASIYDTAGNVMLVAQTTTPKTLFLPASTPAAAPTPTPTPNVEVIFNDNDKVPYATTDITEENGKKETTVILDDANIGKKLENEAPGSTITIPVNNNSDVVVGQLNGQTVKTMENKEAVLEIQTENVTYTLPASEINIDSISNQMGENVQLKDIVVSVSIANSSDSTNKIVEGTTSKNNYQMVVKPIDFEITCTSGGKTVEVSRFNGYVERTVAIPDGIDPSKITTGIVLNKDGTFSHVPTTIIKIDGKYFAKINSLTNSTYTVIWNEVAFSDVESHWAKGEINDMASRLIINGVGNNKFEPNRDITRAEFISIVVKGLGLYQPGTGTDRFKDVTNENWFFDAVSIASEYGLISGTGNSEFKPNNPITREEAMAIISRAMGVTEIDQVLDTNQINQILSTFKDGGSVSTWAKESVASCIQIGVVNGKSNQIVAPLDKITRAEVAVLVKRLLQISKLI